MSSNINNNKEIEESLKLFNIDLSILTNQGKKAMKKLPKMNLNKIKNPFASKLKKNVNINVLSGNIALSIL